MQLHSTRNTWNNFTERCAALSRQRGGARCEQRLHVGQSPGCAVDTSQRWQCVCASNLKTRNGVECCATLGRRARRGSARAQNARGTEPPLSTEASGGNAASFKTKHVKQLHRALCCIEQARDSDGGAKCEQMLHVAQSPCCAVDTSNLKQEKLEQHGVRERYAAVGRCARRGSARAAQSYGCITEALKPAGGNAVHSTRNTWNNGTERCAALSRRYDGALCENARGTASAAIVL